MPWRASQWTFAYGCASKVQILRPRSLCLTIRSTKVDLATLWCKILRPWLFGKGYNEDQNINMKEAHVPKGKALQQNATPPLSEWAFQGSLEKFHPLAQEREREREST